MANTTHRGHGGAGAAQGRPMDPGAVGNGSTEYREVSWINDQLIKATGWRDASDYSAGNVNQNLVNITANVNRVASWNNINISNHKNAFNRQATGVEVWYYLGDSEGRKLAERLSSAIANALGLVNRGAKATTNLYVISNTVGTTVLIEWCFIDNYNDMQKWNANKVRAVNAALGVLGYGGTASAPKPKPVAPKPKPVAPKPKPGTPTKDEYYTSNPGRIVTTVNGVGLYDIKDVNFKGKKTGGNYNRGTYFKIKGMTKSTGGVPRFITESGFLITANKKFVKPVDGASTSKPSTGGTIAKGSVVRVTNPVDYNGTRLSVSGNYNVIEVSGNRVVIARNGQVIAAMNRSNLALVSGGGTSTPKPSAPQAKRITNGGNVQVTNPVDIRGTRLGVSGTYKVMELHSSYAVIGRNGVVTAAVPLGNLKAV